jgi:hypothetical protein
MRFGAVPGAPGEHQKGGARQDEKRRQAGVAEHDDPMQLGLILDRFTGNEMFFSVAQSGLLQAVRSDSLRTYDLEKKWFVEKALQIAWIFALCASPGGNPMVKTVELKRGGGSTIRLKQRDPNTAELRDSRFWYILYYVGTRQDRENMKDQRLF